MTRSLNYMLMRITLAKDRKYYRKWQYTYLRAGATGETWGTSSTKRALGRRVDMSSKHVMCTCSLFIGFVLHLINYNTKSHIPFKLHILMSSSIFTES